MNKYLIMSYEIPEGYHILDDAEMKELFKREKGEDVYLYNPDTKICIGLLCKQVNAIALKLIGKKEVRKTSEQLYAEVYPFINIEKEYEMTAAGENRLGYTFSYEQEGKKYFADNLIITKKKYFFIISASGSFDQAEEIQAEKEKFVRSIALD